MGMIANVRTIQTPVFHLDNASFVNVHDCVILNKNYEINKSF